MNNITELGNKDLQQYDPVKGSMEIHAADAGEKIAQRIKDPTALKNALTTKLRSQREFAEHYRGIFQPGQPQKYSDSSGRISSGVYCRQYGFSDRTVRRWCDRLLDTAKFEAENNAIEMRCWKLMEMWEAANFSSESVQWYTPKQYIDAVRNVFDGHIDLDPATNDLANETVQAAQIFTEEDDGLEQDWHGNVFMNPPYGKKDGDSLAGMFCEKAVAEYELGNSDQTIILVNSVHSQKWQGVLYDYVVCFVDHRIQFVSGDGEENKNPTFQNIFIYLGKNKEAFKKAFSKFGYVMAKI